MQQVLKWVRAILWVAMGDELGGAALGFVEMVLGTRGVSLMVLMAVGLWSSGFVVEELRGVWVEGLAEELVSILMGQEHAI